jgi:hypothetical protein
MLVQMVPIRTYKPAIKMSCICNAFLYPGIEMRMKIEERHTYTPFTALLGLPVTIDADLHLNIIPSDSKLPSC